ncbi:hypothetical protein B0H16DRAFT_1487242 [Mycena metata]|uniref:Uncharacterized protein n=1 Tax=Mycena metata TaxID=1033252 RepID=A0AAD7GHK2_9AGAR|nr:hypothetical protein B0H16DRAFT_1487242 [Mycena metata]
MNFDLKLNKYGTKRGFRGRERNDRNHLKARTSRRTGDREPNIAPQPKIGRGFGCSDLNIFQTIELKWDFKKVALVDVNLNLRGSNCAFVEPSTHCVEIKLKLSVPTDSVKGHTVSGGPIITLHADLKCPQQKKCRSDAGSVKVPLYRFTEYVESPPVNEGKKKCGSGYFAAGWLCCRALQEKTGDDGEEGASGAKEPVEGLNQFGLNGVEKCLVAPHEFRGRLPGVAAGVRHFGHSAACHAVRLPQTIANVPQAASTTAAACSTIAAANCCMFAAVWLPQTAAASQVKSSSTTPRALRRPQMHLPTLYTLPRKASEHSVQHVPLVELPLSAADIAAACGNGTAAFLAASFFRNAIIVDRPTPFSPPKRAKMSPNASKHSAADQEFIGGVPTRELMEFRASMYSPHYVASNPTRFAGYEWIDPTELRQFLGPRGFASTSGNFTTGLAGLNPSARQNNGTQNTDKSCSTSSK